MCGARGRSIGYSVSANGTDIGLGEDRVGFGGDRVRVNGKIGWDQWMDGVRSESGRCEVSVTNQVCSRYSAVPRCARCEAQWTST